MTPDDVLAVFESAPGTLEPNGLQGIPAESTHQVDDAAHMDRGRDDVAGHARAGPDDLASLQVVAA